MIFPNYHLLISTSMIGFFHYYDFWKYEKWCRHAPWWHIRSLQWEDNWRSYWKPYIFVWKLWKCHSYLPFWKYSLLIFVLCSLGFWGDAILPIVNNTNINGTLALRVLIYARELRVDMVCTYHFPPNHESSFSFGWIWLA